MKYGSLLRSTVSSASLRKRSRRAWFSCDSDICRPVPVFPPLPIMSASENPIVPVARQCGDECCYASGAALIPFGNASLPPAHPRSQRRVSAKQGTTAQNELGGLRHSPPRRGRAHARAPSTRSATRTIAHAIPPPSPPFQPWRGVSPQSLVFVY
jgi:hypothetical protein